MAKKTRAVSSIQDIKTRKFFTALVAEFLGVMFLVIVACGSCYSGNAVQISLCFAFAIATLVWSTAHVSGGHLNPAVTFGFLITRRITILRSLFYMVAQSGGAIVGAAILKTLAPNPGSLCTSAPSTGVTNGMTFGIELLITFVLVWTVFATVDGQRKDLSGSGPLAIGLSIGMCHLWAAPVTGAGMNPARVFGPALVSGNWTAHWAYWIGPLIGGALAGIIYDFVFAVNATPAKLRGYFSGGYNNDNYDRLGERDDEAEGSELQKSSGLA